MNLYPSNLCINRDIVKPPIRGPNILPADIHMEYLHMKVKGATWLFHHIDLAYHLIEGLCITLKQGCVRLDVKSI